VIDPNPIPIIDLKASERPKTFLLVLSVKAAVNTPESPIVKKLYKKEIIKINNQEKLGIQPTKKENKALMIANITSTFLLPNLSEK